MQEPEAAPDRSVHTVWDSTENTLDSLEENIVDTVENQSDSGEEDCTSTNNDVNIDAEETPQAAAAQASKKPTGDFALKSKKCLYDFLKIKSPIDPYAEARWYIKVYSMHEINQAHGSLRKEYLKFWNDTAVQAVKSCI